MNKGIKGQLGLSPLAMERSFLGAAGGLGDATQVSMNCGFVSFAISERAYLFHMFITVASRRSGYCCNQIVILCNGNVV